MSVCMCNGAFHLYFQVPSRNFQEECPLKSDFQPGMSEESNNPTSKSKMAAQQ